MNPPVVLRRTAPLSVSCFEPPFSLGALSPPDSSDWVACEGWR